MSDVFVCTVDRRGCVFVAVRPRKNWSAHQILDSMKYQVENYGDLEITIAVDDCRWDWVRPS
jgi:hypothetical protein